MLNGCNIYRTGYSVKLVSFKITVDCSKKLQIEKKIVNCSSTHPQQVYESCKASGS